LVKKTITNEDGTIQDILFEKLVYEDEEEEKEIFKPDPRGMDLAVKVLNFYYKVDSEDSDIFEFVSHSIFENQKGLVAFFLYDNETNHSLEKYVGHVLEDSGNPQDILEEEWQDLKNENLSRWREATLPTWSDETFQEVEMEFIYPYFESTNSMGFAVVTFEDGLEEKYSKQIETLLESARGVYLSNYHENNAESDYGKAAVAELAQEKEKRSKDGGGLKGFFKKKKVG
jgi:hypothetical protein